MTVIIRLSPDRQHATWLLVQKLFDSIPKTHFATSDSDGMPNNEWNSYEFVNNKYATDSARLKATNGHNRRGGVINVRTVAMILFW